MIKVVMTVLIGLFALLTGAETLDDKYREFEERYLSSVGGAVAPEPPRSSRSHQSDLFPNTAPDNFSASKRLVHPIFAKDPFDMYCGCSYDPSTLRVDHGLCGFVTDKWVDRGNRIEAEHVVPASTFGRQRQCWRTPPPGVSGRNHCRETDETFRLMEADPFNLIPVVGSLNAARTNHNMGMVSPKRREFGLCDFYYDNDRRVAEPPDQSKGDVARIYFYFEARYGLRLSDQQRRMFLSWHRIDPVSEVERYRASAIASKVGWSNEFAEGLREP